jgi:hypothetical protein
LIRRRQDVGKVLVLRVSEARVVLIDGHHRCEAYRREGVHTVPVDWFGGTPDQARDAVMEANGKGPMELTPRERSDYAWRQVVLGGRSKREQVELLGLSDGQIGMMRRVLRELKDRAADYDRWLPALAAARGLGGGNPLPEFDIDLAVSELSERLGKTITPVERKNPELVGRALCVLLGANAAKVASWMWDGSRHDEPGGDDPGDRL